MKIALAQINPIVGDIEGNRDKIIGVIKSHVNSDLIIFPELSITGYPPLDLLEHKTFISRSMESLDIISSFCMDSAVIIGTPYCDENDILYNSAVFCADGKVKSVRHKTLLPNYDVFDEKRYFASNECFLPVEFKGRSIALTVCEDIWNSVDSDFTDGRKYGIDPVEEYVKNGADMIVNISASPFVSGKISARKKMISAVAEKFSTDIIYVNQFGGNDSLVFDGSSFAVDKNGSVRAFCGKFIENTVIYNTEDCSCNEYFFDDDELADIENALVCGLRDYAHKSGFKKAVLGLSGGIDSALTAVIAAKALGKENVAGITMPSIYSSEGSISDSRELADNLGIKFEIIPIKGLFDRYLEDLSEVFCGMDRDVAEENLQARIRGNLLMAYSNKFGSLLLSTGNKSELSMGYCTLYGDMNGGLAVISDLPKTLVYRLSEYINKKGVLIPVETITKPPSAELRENQKDQDSLPPYEILDAIIELYIERRLSAKEIMESGFDSETVDFVLRMIDRNEYKRRQAAPGLKITGKAFGTGRRFPIVQRYKQ